MQNYRRVKRINRAAVLAATLLLSACAEHPLQVADKDTYSSLYRQNFAADGKVALRYPRCDAYRGCKEEAFSAGMDWLHRQEEDRLALYDPAGQEVLNLHYRGEQILLRDKNGERLLDRTTLIEELGVPIPVEKLKEWVFRVREQPSFIDDGWQVEVEQWQGEYYRRLTLRQGDYYLRILLTKIIPF